MTRNTGRKTCPLKTCPLTPEPVDWENVQSLIRRPFRHWEASAHMILTIHDPAKARDWLRDELIDRVRFANEIYDLESPDHFGDKAGDVPHVAIAFTVTGLRKLGISEDDLETFDPAFVEGMAPDPKTPDTAGSNPIRQHGSTRRAGILGDLHENHASNWTWGGIDTLPDGRDAPDDPDRILCDQVDLLLMVFAEKDNRTAICDFIRDLHTTDRGVHDPLARVAWQRGDCPLHHQTNLTEREHFGFLDGLSQPIFPDRADARKVSARWREFHEVRVGEFILGYCNERNEMPESPSLTPEAYQGADLPRRAETGGAPGDMRLDFGKNGTYLVARQLHQNVGTFDGLVARAAELIKADHEPAPIPEAAGLLMGRGLDGEPLVPDHGDPKDAKAEYPTYNDYGFHQTDPSGLLCPIGSHVRRANPRDSLEPNPDAALSMAKQHRILRRSRIYGDRSKRLGFWDEDGDGRRRMPDPTLSPDERKQLRDAEDAEERGLFFICLNTDIAGQFEFIQDTWLNNPNFGDLEGERDAILAASIDTKVSLTSMPFTRWMDRNEKDDRGDYIGKPVVEMRGGAYFFLPGRHALQTLADASTSLRPREPDAPAFPIQIPNEEPTDG